MKLAYHHGWVILLIAAIVVAVINIFQPKRLQVRNSDVHNTNIKDAYSTQAGIPKANVQIDTVEEPTLRYKQRDLDIKYAAAMAVLINYDGSLTQSAFDISNIPPDLRQQVQERCITAHEGIRQLNASNTVLVSAEDGKYEFIVKKLDAKGSEIIQKFHEGITNLCGEIEADSLTNLLDNSLTTFKSGTMDTNITIDTTQFGEASYSIEYYDADGNGGFAGGPLDDLKKRYGHALHDSLVGLIAK